jgi:class III poly(R)-hydroxyalkanoic acid synthase PhaE subunit
MSASSTQQSSDWFSSQQQYWDTWFEQQRKFFGAAGATSPSFGSASGFQGPQEQWAELLKTWQSALAGNEKTTDTEVLQHYFTKAGETYLNMLQQFYQGTGQAKTLEQMTKEWTDNLQKFYTGTAQTGKDPFSALDPLNFFASFPGIGYTREKQEQLNHLYQQWSDYEVKAREYNASMAKVGLEAIQKFQEYVANPPKDAEPLTSLKEVYTKWVDICEGIYAEYAMTEEYTQLYGEVVNALMTFKKQQNKLIDDLVDQVNLPTRTEIDSLHQRVHALRREVAALRAELKGAPPKAAAKPAAKATAKPAAKKGKKK